MVETTTLGLPLLAGNQAQKHVTVNEALLRIDALAQLTLQSKDIIDPPAAAEGQVWAVPAGATGAWDGWAGHLALWLGAGWLFVVPGQGWSAFIVDLGVRASFDGSEWVPGLGSASFHGAGFIQRSVEIDHQISSGTSSIVGSALPANSVVYGVTGRVASVIGGATTMEMGVAESTNRYGSGIGTDEGSWARGLTGSPLTYYSATDLILTATGGTFDGTGVFRVAIHYVELTLPRI